MPPQPRVPELRPLAQGRARPHQVKDHKPLELVHHTLSGQMLPVYYKCAPIWLIDILGVGMKHPWKMESVLSRLFWEASVCILCMLTSNASLNAVFDLNLVAASITWTTQLNYLPQHMHLCLLLTTTYWLPEEMRSNSTSEVMRFHPSFQKASGNQQRSQQKPTCRESGAWEVLLLMASGFVLLPLLKVGGLGN